MNDFSEIENELGKLRPLSPSAELFARVENALVDPAAEDKVVRPDRFRFNWLSLGAGLAAAAAILFFLHLDLKTTSQSPSRVAATSPVPEARSTTGNAGLIPSGTTQVVYHTRDEGLVFPAGSNEPVRRVRSQMHETLQWRNAATGASLRVSYPTEQVELIPVSGQ